MMAKYNLRYKLYSVQEEEKQRQAGPTTAPRKQGDSGGAECVRGGSAGCLALKGL